MCKTFDCTPLHLEQFAKVLPFLSFVENFTTVTSLCKRARILVLKKYASILDRRVFLDLSSTTKLIKKMPKHIA